MQKKIFLYLLSFYMAISSVHQRQHGAFCTWHPNAQTFPSVISCSCSHFLYIHRVLFAHSTNIYSCNLLQVGIKPCTCIYLHWNVIYKSVIVKQKLSIVLEYDTMMIQEPHILVLRQCTLYNLVHPL